MQSIHFILIILVSIFHKINCRKLQANSNSSYILFILLFLQHLECIIDIKSDLNRTSSSIKEPIFLKYSGNEYKLMIPEDGKLRFKQGESALIACTSDSKTNTLTFSTLKE